MEPNLPLTWYTVTEWSGVPADHFMVFSNPEWQWCIQWLISGGGGGGVCVCVCGGGGVKEKHIVLFYLLIVTFYLVECRRKRVFTRHVIAAKNSCSLIMNHWIDSESNRNVNRVGRELRGVFYHLNERDELPYRTRFHAGGRVRSGFLESGRSVRDRD